MGRPKGTDKYRDVAERFWDNVESIIKDRNLTWKWLAEQLGVGQRTLASRKSMVSNVSIGSAMEIAKILNVSVDYLLYTNITEEN